MGRQSLRKQVRIARRELAKETGLRRRAAALARSVFERTRENDWLTWAIILAVGMGGLWAPPLFAVRWPSPTVIERFLPIAWQVEAAAVGLSLAVVVFSFQTFTQSRYAGSVRDFARYSLATPIVVLGLVSLLVDGLALLGVGRDAPGGWAGIWASLLTIVSVALLPVLLLLLLRSLEARSLHLWRIRRLRDLMRLEVQEDLEARLAYSHLSGACETAGWDFLPLFGATLRQGWREIRPLKDGVVTDVSLELLPQVAALCPAGNSPVLLVRHGQRVSESHPIVLLPPSAEAPALSKVQRLLTIVQQKESQEGALESSIKLLHQQALQAFRDGNAVWYVEIANAYREVLIALPHAWAEYGVKTFHQGLAQPFDLISRAPIELVIRQLHLELRSAFRSSEPEIAERAVSLLYSTLLRSREVGAEALSKSMLDLLVYAYQLAAASPDKTLAQIGIDRITHYLLEFGGLVLHQAHRST